MAFVLMTAEEIKELGLESQDYPHMDGETGVLDKLYWKFEKEFISDDLLLFRRKYTNGTDVVYLISTKTAVAGGSEYTKYEFYKET